ncbi:MAG: UDP-3-O-(3-hydroxymyristoyl)glucosamine N-acyltransferase [Synergistaceae bacterium]|jgi:UDP-3-O-[3-hydroxymyristoyl] glucosamine N-acyltransferase|nr:UDP-3-O-(3-hydroxymyristoyl)glucosamine N-acyltransferase [Synergistaceae bacterium]
MTEMTLGDAARLTGGLLVGDGDRIVRGVCSPEDAREDMLCVIWDKKALDSIPKNIPVLSSTGAVTGRDGIELENPRSSLIFLMPHFDRRIGDPPGVHPSAAVHPSASLGEDCVIGPCCVVSSGAVVGSRAVLQANVFVGKNVIIGEGTRVEAGAALQDFVEIGGNVIIHSGAAIGCDGFGFAPGEDGAWRRIPQTGTVIIGDDAEIGPNCTVDRATFGATRIGRGTKLGACIHIAHNCDIGPDSMLVGFSAIGGSVRTGRGLLAAGMTGIADHVSVGDRVTIAGRTGVTKDVPDGLTISGFPAQEHSAEKRFQAYLRKVRDYGERLKKLERILDGK